MDPVNIDLPVVDKAVEQEHFKFLQQWQGVQFEEELYDRSYDTV